MPNRATRAWRCGCLLAGFLTAACGGTAPEPIPVPPVASGMPQEPGAASPAVPAAEIFTLDAKVGGGMHSGGVWSAEIHLGADRVALVAFEYSASSWRRDWEMIHGSRRLVLEAGDVDALREAIDRSGFFGRWPEGEHVTDQDGWTVSVRSGERSGRREIYAQRKFRETERLLRALIDRAVADHAIATGRADILGELPGLTRADDPQHAQIVAALKETALRGTSAASRTDAVLALREAMESAEFAALLDAALQGAGPADRDAVIAALVDRGAIAARLLQPQVVLPWALAALESSWRDWGAPPKERARFLRDCASAFVICHDARAVPVFERIVVELSTPERPVPLPALAAMGDAAIESLVRLLESPRVELRIAAAQMCEGLASELTSPSACARPPGADPRVATTPFRERLVPLLRRAADDAAADSRLRTAAAEALVSFHDRPSPPGWSWHRLDWN